MPGVVRFGKLRMYRLERDKVVEYVMLLTVFLSDIFLWLCIKQTAWRNLTLNIHTYAHFQNGNPVDFEFISFGVTIYA